MPKLADMLESTKKAAKIMNERYKIVMAKRKSRAIKKAAKSKGKKRRSPVGLKALGIY